MSAPQRPRRPYLVPTSAQRLASAVLTRRLAGATSRICPRCGVQVRAALDVREGWCPRCQAHTWGPKARKGPCPPLPGA